MTDYKITPTAPKLKKYVKAWLVQPKEHPETEYIVSMTASGVFACSCPNWKFRRATLPGGECKHIRHLKKAVDTSGRDFGDEYEAVVTKAREVKLPGDVPDDPGPSEFDETITQARKTKQSLEAIIKNARWRL